MSIQSEITRLNGLKTRIRAQLVTLGLVQSGASLSDCTSAVEKITNQGNISVQVKEGESYTIPKGYHNGSGTVVGVAGGGSYELQSKTVTPTKAQQSITPDSGYYGLDSVTVNAIPENFADVGNVTITADKVLANEVFVNALGVEGTGTLPNVGSHSATIDGLTTMSATIPKGYHDGTGSISLTNDIELALAAI